MSDLTSLSTQIIDEGAPIFPVRINQELSEIGDGVMLVESFSNVIAVKTDEGLVLSDTSGATTGQAVVQSLRAASDAPFHTILYTHGHIDHVGGAGAFVSNSAASDSCRDPEKTSICFPHMTSMKPVFSSAQSHSASSRAPAIQPDQRSMSSFASCGTI